MRTMNNKYLRIAFSLVLTLNYFFSRLKPTMARHTHHHRIQELGCSRCPPGFGVHQNCTRQQDTQCHPCQAGHYSSHHSAHRPCYPCSLCGLGLYIAHECTADRDTICDSCHTYKGPHNVDYFEKCIQPLIERTGNMSTWSGDENPASLHVKDRPHLPFPLLIISTAIATAGLTVVIVGMCLVLWKGLPHKKVNSGHPYEAVATQEAVML